MSLTVWETVRRIEVLLWKEKSEPYPEAFAAPSSARVTTWLRSLSTACWKQPRARAFSSMTGADEQQRSKMFARLFYISIGGVAFVTVLGGLGLYGPL